MRTDFPIRKKVREVYLPGDLFGYYKKNACNKKTLIVL